MRKEFKLLPEKIEKFQMDDVLLGGNLFLVQEVKNALLLQNWIVSKIAYKTLEAVLQKMSICGCWIKFLTFQKFLNDKKNSFLLEN